MTTINRRALVTGAVALVPAPGKTPTKRELEVIQMVSGGLANKEVARRLDISEGTVKIHLHNIYQKLDISNRTALAALALAQHEGLASPPNMMELLDAISAKCNECCAGSTQGAKSCMAKDCPLWPYRMGIIQSAERTCARDGK
jgi:DNA-binding CsgD family transcriptional regulator